VGQFFLDFGSGGVARAHLQNLLNLSLGAFSLPQAWHLLKKPRLRLRKSRSHASEGDAEVIRRKRQEFIACMGEIEPERLIFLHEKGGVTTAMTRLYARSEGGERIYEATPGKPLANHNHHRRHEPERHDCRYDDPGGTDCEIFRAYVEQALCPALTQHCRCGHHHC
jgi:hypothetical protein